MLPAVFNHPPKSLRFFALAALILCGAGAVARADPDQSLGEAISSDGRFVVFSSNAPASDIGVDDIDDTNGRFDVFLRDRFRRVTLAISRDRDGFQTPSGDSFAGGMSADGRWLVFLSDAPDVVSGVTDTNQTFDAFLYDTQTGQTRLLSRRDEDGSTTANGATTGVSISADGKWVALVSLASNIAHNQRPLVPSGASNVFLIETAANVFQPVLVSRSSGSLPALAATANGSSSVTGISADGEVVVFTSGATDLISGLLDANGKSDVFVYRRSTRKVTLLSRAMGSPVLQTSDGASGGGQISADGRWIAYQSTSRNLVQGQVDSGASYDEFLFDRATGKSVLVSHASSSPVRAVGVRAHALSADGRYLAFASAASNLVDGQVDSNGKLDVFLYERISGKTALVTHRQNAFTTTTEGANDFGLDIDREGRSVAILSRARNLVPGQVDPLGKQDAFVYDRVQRTMSLVSHRRGALKAAADGATSSAHLSRDGTTIAFTSAAGDLTDLRPTDVDGSDDVFAYLRGAQAVEAVSRASNVPFVPCKRLDLALPTGIRHSIVVPGYCGVPSTARSVLLSVDVSRSQFDGSLRFYPGNVGDPASFEIPLHRGEASPSVSFTVPLATDGTGTIALLPSFGGRGTWSVDVTVFVAGYSD